MRNLKRYLLFSMVCLVAFIFAVQAPFLFSQNNYSHTNGFVQPSSPDFTRWVQNPVYYQSNDENCHGFGLIPSPVDCLMMTHKNEISIQQSKLIAPKTGKSRFEFF
jgi:hypothetical protein